MNTRHFGNLDPHPHQIKIRIWISIKVISWSGLLKKCLDTWYAHIPYILACHLQIDADPDPDFI
jgi:hypothetical protein